MQILRALSKWLLLEQGWIPLHSACAAKNGRTICVTGGKASGKTSTLLNLLARNGCDLVAVDKFLIRDGGRAGGLRDPRQDRHPRRHGDRAASGADLAHREATPFFPNISPHDVGTSQRPTRPTAPDPRREDPPDPGRTGRAVRCPSPPPLRSACSCPRLRSVPRRTPGAHRPRRGSRLLTEVLRQPPEQGQGFLLHFFDLSDALLQQRLAARWARTCPRGGLPGAPEPPDERADSGAGRGSPVVRRQDVGVGR